MDFYKNSGDATEPSDETQDCGCPPGMCLGDEESFDGATGALFAALLDGPADDEFDDDEDFDDGDTVTVFDRKEAVAQVGRIAESLANVARVHAALVSDLLDA